MEWAIEDARRKRDSRQVWYLMRVLGGTGRRERKRNTKDILREDVDVDTWLRAMQKPGGEGGCEATLVSKLGEHEAYDRKLVLDVPIDDECLPEHTLATPAKVLEAVQNMRYKRGVPRGRARKGT